MSIDLTPESVLAVELGISLESLRTARREHLTEGVHWQRVERVICLKPEGIQLLTGLDLTAQKKEGGRAVRIVVAQCRGKGRFLAGRIKDSGAICSVRLTARGIVAQRFRIGDELDCQPEGTAADRFIYSGRPPYRPGL